MKAALIKAVYKFPPLWDPQQYSFTDPPQTERMWNEVAKLVGMPGTSRYCHEKWESITNKFYKVLKRRSKHGDNVPKYKYEHLLDFLVPSLTNRMSVYVQSRRLAREEKEKRKSERRENRRKIGDSNQGTEEEQKSEEDEEEDSSEEEDDQETSSEEESLKSTDRSFSLTNKRSKLIQTERDEGEQYQDHPVKDLAVFVERTLCSFDVEAFNEAQFEILAVLTKFRDKLMKKWGVRNCRATTGYLNDNTPNVQSLKKTSSKAIQFPTAKKSSTTGRKGSLSNLSVSGKSSGLVTTKKSVVQERTKYIPTLQNLTRSSEDLPQPSSSRTPPTNTDLVTKDMLAKPMISVPSTSRTTASTSQSSDSGTITSQHSNSEAPSTDSSHLQEKTSPSSQFDSVTYNFIEMGGTRSCSLGDQRKITQQAVTQEDTLARFSKGLQQTSSPRTPPTYAINAHQALNSDAPAPNYEMYVSPSKSQDFSFPMKMTMDSPTKISELEVKLQLTSDEVEEMTRNILFSLDESCLPKPKTLPKPSSSRTPLTYKDSGNKVMPANLTAPVPSTSRTSPSVSQTSDSETITPQHSNPESPASDSLRLQEETSHHVDDVVECDSLEVSAPSDELHSDTETPYSPPQATTKEGIVQALDSDAPATNYELDVSATAIQDSSFSVNSQTIVSEPAKKTPETSLPSAAGATDVSSFQMEILPGTSDSNPFEKKTKRKPSFAISVSKAQLQSPGFIYTDSRFLDFQSDVSLISAADAIASTSTYSAPLFGNPGTSKGRVSAVSRSATKFVDLPSSQAATSDQTPVFQTTSPIDSDDSETPGPNLLEDSTTIQSTTTTASHVPSSQTAASPPEALEPSCSQSTNCGPSALQVAIYQPLNFELIASQTYTQCQHSQTATSDTAEPEAPSPRATVSQPKDSKSKGTRRKSSGSYTTQTRGKANQPKVPPPVPPKRKKSSDADKAESSENS